VKLPKPGKHATRIAGPAEAAALIAAVPARDRALWATALYAGLRRGELQALRWSDVDLAAGVIHVHHGWDEVEGEQETKGRNRRRVPIVAVLRDHLLEHRVRHGGEPGFVFGREPEIPFTPNAVTKRADRAWREAGLERIVLHDCRHTFVSLLAAAHVDVVAISRFAGHADVGFTLNRYAHLFEGSEAHAAELLGAYLAAGEERAAAATRELTGASTGAPATDTA
jgi:integrase